MTRSTCKVDGKESVLADLFWKTVEVQREPTPRAAVVFELDN